jgi:hypothetical protein
MHLEPLGHEPVTVRAVAWGLASGAFGLAIGALWLLVGVARLHALTWGLGGLGAIAAAAAALGFAIGIFEALLVGGAWVSPWRAVSRGAVNAGNFGSLAGGALGMAIGSVQGSLEVGLALWTGTSAVFLVTGAISATFGAWRRPRARAAVARVVRFTAVSAAVGFALAAAPALLALASRVGAGDPSVAAQLLFGATGVFAAAGLVAGLLDGLVRS